MEEQNKSDEAEQTTPEKSPLEIEKLRAERRNCELKKRNLG